MGYLDKIRSLPFVIAVSSDQQNAGPLLDITINREVAPTYGIAAAAIDNALNDAFGQRIISTIYTSLNQYRVVMEVLPKYQFGPEALNDIYVTSSAGQQVPLRTLANTVTKVAPFKSIIRDSSLRSRSPAIWRRAPPLDRLSTQSMNSI